MKKIAEGSNYELEIEWLPSSQSKLVISQEYESIIIHIDDIPELIKELLERISSKD